MSLYHLLYYTIFIILFTKVDVLLGVDKKRVSFNDETEVKQFKSEDAPSKINKHEERVSWGSTNITIFDSNDPSSKVIHRVSRKGSRFRNTFRRKPTSPDHRVSMLNQYIEKFSLNGKIWHRVWDNCILHSCLMYNKYETLQKNFLTETNYYRKVHGSKPLILDTYLSSKALHVAIRSARIGRWIFNGKKSNAVNFETISFGLSPLLINKWYKEYRKYSYRKPVGTPESMHFSNLVWKDTKMVGIGIAQKGSDLFICFMFYPEGNQESKFKDNVHKPKYHLVNSRSFFRE
uniref:SCP domain-containing protein n=1 Tax=Strongyloides papillosus TaxID=174720 RepID=A0A0N5B297_STREA